MNTSALKKLVLSRKIEVLVPDTPEGKVTARRLKRAVAISKLVQETRKGPVKIILGSGSTLYPGWCETGYPWLDATNAEQWEFFFSKHGISAVLAEHVFEHIDPADLPKVLQNIYRYLLPGGHLRIAVPDGYFPDPAYIEAVRPGGSGAGASGHLALWNIDSMTKLVGQAGFRVEPLEYFDKQGKFHENPWSPDEGMVKRTRQNDRRNSPTEIKYTSLLIDAIKPR